MNKKLKLFVLLFFVGLFYSGCKTLDVFSPSTFKEEISERELIRSIQNNSLNYQQLFFRRAFIELDFNGKNQAFRANIFIRKDSAILVSVIPVMGIELYRIQLTKDDIIVLDRMNRTLMRSDYRSISQRFLFNFSYEQFQSILSNSVFVYPEGSTSLRHFEMVRDSSFYLLRSDRNGDGSFQDLHILPEIFKLSFMEVRFPETSVAMSLAYSDFIMVDPGIPFPSHIRIQGQRLQEQMAFDINYSSVEIDGSQSLNFSIPNGYAEITL